MAKEEVEKDKQPLKIYGLTIVYAIIGNIFMQPDTMLYFDYQTIFWAIFLTCCASFFAAPTYLLIVNFCVKNNTTILKTLSSILIGFFTAYTIPFFSDITMGQREFCNDNIALSDTFFVLQDCPLNANFFMFFFAGGVLITMLLLFMHGFVWLITKAYKEKPWLKKK